MAAADRADVPMLAEALAYLRAELPVFPVCSPAMIGHKHRDPQTREMVLCTGGGVGKTPLIRWRGCQLDLPSEDDVRSWWSQWPDANIGMATGELSGVLVLDADGTEARKGCLQRGGLDETPTVWTGKIGGAHFHLRYPDGANVRNFARKLPGTDMRGEGGYVLLPPSLHASGNRYRWADGTQGIPPSPPPRWLLELIDGTGTRPDGATSDHERFDADEALLGFDAGHRDDGLFRFACRMRHDDTPQAYAEILIQEAARNCRPPFEAVGAVEKVRRAYREYQPGNVGPEAEFDEEFRAGATTATPPTDPPPAVFTRPISELLAMPEVDPDWMVADLFTVGSNGWVGAEPKVGKSWTVLELVYALSTGSPFLGRFSVKQPRRVMYIQEEDSLQRVLRRFKRLIQGDPTRVNPSDDYLRWSIRVGFKIDDVAWINRLIEDLERYAPEVVVMDVFNMLHNLEENKQSDMTRLLQTLMQLNRRFGCAFIIVHHNRKPQPGSEARPNQMIRGSGVLAGWGECSLYLRRSKEKDTIIVTPESKDAPEMEDFTIKLCDQDNGGITLEMGEVEKIETLSKGDVAVLEAVQAITNRGIGATTRLISEAVGRDRSTTQARLTRLVDSGYLTATAISDTPTATKIYTVVENLS